MLVREAGRSLVALLQWRVVSSRAGRRRWVHPLILIVLVTSMQYLLIAIPSVEPGRFDRRAREVQRSDTWRYGYVRQFHGAMLVKARRTKGEPAFVPPDPADRIAPIMLRELRTRRWKASLELVFYGLLVGVLKAGLPRVTGARASRRSRLYGCAIAGLAGALYVTMAMLPYLAIGYGEPFLSAQRGAGAIIFRALVPETTTRYFSSVSYGILLQWWVLWPLVALEDLFRAVGVFDVLVPLVGTRGMPWLLAVLFWGVAAAMVSFFGYARRPVSYAG